jgi:hypothetical protein
MKATVKILLTIIFSAFISESLDAQQIKYCQIIGKGISDVLRVYGKPVHQDLTNPNMKCIFYQTKTSRTTFIADKTGVYQIQADLSFDSENDAVTSINKFLTDCVSRKYEIDTLNPGNFNIRASGVRMTLNLFQNTYMKKYEVKFKAEKSESK